MNAHPDYRRIVELAIDREMEVIGPEQAVSLANNIDGLDVDSDGTVRSMGDSGERTLSSLVEAYKEASGEIAAFVIARRLENAVEDHSILPENVRRHV
jgi:hypothetical protein